MASESPKTEDDVRSLTLPDGRTLSYAVYGAPSGFPTVFYLHGFPSSHPEARQFHDAALARGVRLLAMNRPGFGSSTFQANRRLLDLPADLLALADNVGAQTFGIIGVSGGAPYALACALTLPKDRLRGVALVSGLYPTTLGTAGMLTELRALLWVAPLPGAGWLLRHVFSYSRARAEANPNLMDDMIKGRPAPDREVYERNEGNFKENTLDSVKGATPEGAAWEARLYGSPWGFDLADVDLGPGRIVMWHGAVDANTPVAMAQKAASMLKNAELRVLDNEAHASTIIHTAGEVLQTLKGLVA
ncbi:alpha/beta-hydrolase [Auricularia subglabra TFB-10046 SS5]|nr:alpha/beta-hydrolase [Auricularia subglabra TFB-10046 SS5]